MAVINLWENMSEILITDCYWLSAAPNTFEEQYGVRDTSKSPKIVTVLTSSQHIGILHLRIKLLSSFGPEHRRTLTKPANSVTFCCRHPTLRRNRFMPYAYSISVVRCNNATSNITSKYVLGTSDSQLAAKWFESCWLLN
jgi:hypothetical protein